MIDKDNIFNLFPDPGEAPDDKEDFEVNLGVVESAHYKIGMFTKLILGQKQFLRQVKSFFERSGRKIDVKDHNSHSKFVVYNRAWHYIKDIDLMKPEHIADLVISDIYDISYALALAIKYFEKTEEYEKCAHLFKIQKFLEEFESQNDGNMTFVEKLKNTLEK